MGKRTHRADFKLGIDSDRVFSPSIFVFVQLPTWLALLRRRIANQLSSSAGRPHALASVLVIRLDALGDLVLTTPLFRELKRSYPLATITALVQRNCVSLLQTNPHIDELISIPPKRRRNTNAGKRWEALRCAWSVFRSQLHNRRFDIVLSPRWDIDEDLATMLCLLVKTRERVGYTNETSPAKTTLNRGFGRAFSRCLPAGPLQHEAMRNLDLVEAIGGRIADDRLEIHLTRADRAYATHLLRKVPSQRLLIALGIGAQAQGRRWPLVNYALTIAQLRIRYDIQPAITCAPHERDEAIRLAQMLPVRAIIECGPEVRHTCALLEKCDLFIGNDSGAAHMAAAMDCKTLVVCRHPRDGDPAHPNSPHRFAPYAAAARVLQPEHGLNECNEHCRRTEPHCILGVSVEDVVTAALELLATTEASHSYAARDDA